MVNILAWTFEKKLFLFVILKFLGGVIAIKPSPFYT
jgi:hypothetical protein